MANEKPNAANQNHKAQFDPMLGAIKFNVPVVGQGGNQANTQQNNTPDNPSNDPDPMPTEPIETDEITSGIPPTPPLATGQPPVSTQVFMEDVLRQYLGDFVGISATFNGDIREFRGNLLEVGTNVITIEDRRLGSRVILPTLFINFVNVPIFQQSE